ncbi:MAG: HD-GYP domain-containing protein, partial [Phascolarctobacterium sp.]
VYILCIEKEEKYILEKKSVRSVWRMSMQIVQTLVKTIDAKDSYTNGHSARVAQYSVILAKRMGFKEEELGRLEYTALLHDVGKIGVSDAILNKKGKLTEEEYAIIKEHSKIGAQILSTITELPDVAVGARYHHERYDGKGYPDGLKGEEIPLFARIIAVADSYDAMTSKRSYRDALPQELVRQEITRGIGTQFDPRIAKLMLIIMDEDKDYKLREIE